ncbi:hypothetical protein KUH32_13370 [Thalassococcus sp. CAU 1522]|uniref:DedA family protein n=1 Tax=Thalassococcus arenae TaxID=2851652 RepID=A0ABS6N9T2_9RHOB|nr:hypothetical protein [Thalassococcus arenae]MBV2360770.1 hypothetical protein [Thalassococcus arenae]
MEDRQPGTARRIGRTVLRLGASGLVIAAGLSLFDVVQDQLHGTAPGMLPLALLLLAFVLLMALPFVPGVEIGIALLLMRGAEIAPYVWLATTAALCLAYLAGRWLPTRWLVTALEDLHLRRGAALVARISGTPPALRMRWLGSRLPLWLRPMVRRGRYPALAVLLNLPGNAVLGGGGGIALMAGLSGIFTAPATLLTVLLATAPVPLAVWLFGPTILPWTG